MTEKKKEKPKETLKISNKKVSKIKNEKNLKIKNERLMTPDIMHAYREKEDKVKIEFMKMNEFMEKAKLKLSKDEKEALRKYNTNGYIVINNFLRRKYMHENKVDSWVRDQTMFYLTSLINNSDIGKSVNNMHVSLGMLKVISDQAQSNIEKYIKNIDDIFTNKAPRLKNDTILYRGESSSNVHTYLDASVGDTLEFPSYFSSSLDPSVSSMFTGAFQSGAAKGQSSFPQKKNSNKSELLSLKKQTEMTKFKKGVYLIVHAPKNMPFLFLDNVNKKVWEQEVLFPKGMCLKILKKSKMKDPLSLKYVKWKQNEEKIPVAQKKQEDFSLKYDEIYAVHVELFQKPEPKKETDDQKKDKKDKKEENKDNENKQSTKSKNDSQDKSKYKNDEGTDDEETDDDDNFSKNFTDFDTPIYKWSDLQNSVPYKIRNDVVLLKL